MKKTKKTPEGYDRFDELTRKLLIVPKAELDVEAQTYEGEKKKVVS